MACPGRELTVCCEAPTGYDHCTESLLLIGIDDGEYFPPVCGSSEIVTECVAAIAGNPHQKATARTTPTRANHFTRERLSNRTPNDLPMPIASLSAQQVVQ